MGNLITKLKGWMHWRDVSFKDLVMVGATLGFLLAILTVFLRGACLAL